MRQRREAYRIAKVNPRGTSSTCPRCGAKLVEVGHRRLRCPRCGLEGDRDVIATINIYRRYVSVHSRCGAPGVALNAPKPDEGPSGMRGNRDEAMTVRQQPV